MNDVWWREGPSRVVVGFRCLLTTYRYRQKRGERQNLAVEGEIQFYAMLLIRGDYFSDFDFEIEDMLNENEVRG